MAEPTLSMPDRWGLLSPRDLTDQLAHGLEPRAELRVHVPYGKSERLVTVRLDAAQCLHLAQAAIEAARLLQPTLGTTDELHPCGCPASVVTGGRGGPVEQCSRCGGTWPGR